MTYEIVVSQILFTTGQKEADLHEVAIVAEEIMKQDIIFCISVDIYLFLQRDSLFLS